MSYVLMVTVKTAYLAHCDFVSELLKELQEQTQVLEVHERLIFAEGPPIRAAWAQNIWRNPQEIQFQSISQAAQALRDIQRNWALYPIVLHRRAHLIQEKLPRMNSKILEFPKPVPRAPLGSWTLIENEKLIAASDCSSPFAHGEVHFKEDRENPPSRAYLKLWEGLTLMGLYPEVGSRCVDLGSSPGGWTWALHGLGAEVISVDKAPLSPSVAALPGVQSLMKDAFTLDPLSVGPIDWVFSDVICYPNRLLELVGKWRQAHPHAKFMCTIKFQGDQLSREDTDAVRAFANIPGSKVCHLFHNKHEVTWMLR